MRRNPMTFELEHVTSRDIMLTIDGTFRVAFVSIDSIYGVSNI